jgi:hypothetical protein
MVRMTLAVFVDTDISPGSENKMPDCLRMLAKDHLRQLGDLMERGAMKRIQVRFSKDPWLSVPVSRLVWLYRIHPILTG